MLLPIPVCTGAFSWTWYDKDHIYKPVSKVALCIEFQSLPFLKFFVIWNDPFYNIGLKKLLQQV